MKDILQKSLKSVLDQADAITAQVTAENRAPSDDEMKSYNALLQQAEGYKNQLDSTAKRDTLEAWANASNGQSVVKTGFDRMALPGEGAIPGVSAEAKSGELYSLDGVGEQKLQALKSGAYKDAFSGYIRNIGLGRAMKGDAMKVLNEGTDTAGGFWVPPDVRADLIKKMATMTAVRQNATIYTTGSDVISFPKVTYTTDQNYTAGTRFTWQDSAPLSSDITEATNPIAGRANIPVHSATAAIILTREQLEDNQFDILGYISQILGEAYALGEEDAFFNGTGAGQPAGMLSSVANANLTVATGSGDGMKVVTGVSSALTWAGVASGSTGTEDSTKGLLGMENALPPQYESGAKWYGAKSAFAAVRALVDLQKRPLWQQSDGMYQAWVNGYPPTLLGYPIAKSQFITALGASSYSLLFGDMKGYFVIDRVGLSIEVLREVRALRGEVVVYARKRVGGQIVRPWMLKALCAST
jgi:HK97 family phage major capsid protein